MNTPMNNDMNTHKRKKNPMLRLTKNLPIFICIGVSLCFFNHEVYGQSASYVVQVKDVLKFSFWEYPELNSQTRVDSDGSINLPIVGRITAAGLSIKVLREKIISQMALYNKVVTQLSIEVLEYGSNIVHVTGHVRNPGKYSWEQIPNLWQILLAAGGPLETAALDEIMVIRSQEGGRIYKVDLSGALQSASLDELMEIKPGDTIQVLSQGGAERPSPSPLAKRDFIYIFGAIARAGAHPYDPETSNLVEVLGRAGGPANDANLKEVKHISVANGAPSIAVINLRDYFNKTTPLPMPIGPGDTIIIPRKSALVQRAVNIVFTTTLTTILSFTIFSILR